MLVPPADIHRLVTDYFIAISSYLLLSGFETCTSQLFVCLFGFLMSLSTTRLYRGRAPRQERLTISRAATHETELGDHDFCLSRSHYTDTDPTCRERAATAGIEPGTSSPGVARSTAELPRPPSQTCWIFEQEFPDYADVLVTTGLCTQVESCSYLAGPLRWVLELPAVRRPGGSCYQTLSSLPGVSNVQFSGRCSDCKE